MGKIEKLLNDLKPVLESDETLQSMIVKDKSDVSSGKYHLEADLKAYYIGDVISKQLERGDSMIELLDKVTGEMIVVCYIDINSHIEYQAFDREGNPRFGYIFSIDNRPIEEPVLSGYRPK